MKIPAERRLVVPRATWMAARARNAMHRPVFIGAVSVGTFITALVAMVVMPQRQGRPVRDTTVVVPDTLALLRVVSRTEAVVAQANADLIRARTRAAEVAQRAMDTLSPALVARRDSLGERVAEVDRLIARSESSPLAASYRALAEVPEVGADARVKALLDSLTDIEREREGFGATGGADPVFVALTSRATEIGRAVTRVAAERRAAMQAEIARLAPPPRPTGAALAAADTTRPQATRDSAISALTAAAGELATARTALAEIERRATAAQERSMSFVAPPSALLGSAIVFGIVLGFGAALAQELRHPRLADEQEAERVAGVRVISVITPRPRTPERSRRLADRLAPPHIDPLNTAHQLAWLFVAPPASSLLLLTVSGESPEVAAIVAANLGAVAADEARNVILIDADAERSPVASLLRVPARPGLAEIIAGQIAWPEATQHATIGRDRVIDVMPGGATSSSQTAAQIPELLARETARLARHYDTTLVVASKHQTLSGLPGALARHDVLYCAQLGATRISTLRKAIEGIRLAGGTPIGLVLWDDAVPTLTSPDETPPPLRARTAEMEAFVAGRQR